MVNVVWPVNAVTGAPAYSGRMQRQAMSVALGGATAARPLGAQSGVRPGTPATTVALTDATHYVIHPHAGILDLQTSALAGPYWYAIDADATGTVNAAHATWPRKDILWVRLDDPAETDGSSVPAVVPGYTAGTAASTPAVPATPARCMRLATISVPQSGGGSPTITFDAPYTAAPGGARVGASVNLTDSWATQATRTHTGTWSLGEDSGGFVGALTGNTTPIVIPAGKGGLYAVSLGLTNSAAMTAASWVQVQLGGTLLAGSLSVYRAAMSSAASANGSVAVTLPLAAGCTLTVITGLTASAYGVSATLSCYRIGD